MISIHAPREGSDTKAHQNQYERRISIHAPREGSDALLFGLNLFCGEFLSTLPARGATSSGSTLWEMLLHFYPRSPRGERRLYVAICPQILFYFYPRSPRGERPATLLQGLAGDTISIHAPREGSDRLHAAGQLLEADFYPRSPRGERRRAAAQRRGLHRFLSTLPARGATITYFAT